MSESSLWLGPERRPTTPEEWDAAVAALGPRPQPPLETWRVEVSLTISTVAYVSARTQEEAVSKAQRGGWNDLDVQGQFEVTDGYVRSGNAVLNR